MIELKAMWEISDGDYTAISCGDCAKRYITEQPDAMVDGIFECRYCFHEFDYPPTCEGCDAYLEGSLTREGIQYVEDNDFPKDVLLAYGLALL